MEKSKCHNAEVSPSINRKGRPVYICHYCNKYCELMEQSTTDGKELSAKESIKQIVEKRSSFYGGDICRTAIMESDIDVLIEELQEYASQKDAQIQALSKVIEYQKQVEGALIEKNNDLSRYADKLKSDLMMYAVTICPEKDAENERLSKEVEELKNSKAYMSLQYDKQLVQIGELLIAGDKMAEALKGIAVGHIIDNEQYFDIVQSLSEWEKLNK